MLAAILALMLMATGASILATTQLGLDRFRPVRRAGGAAAASLRVAGARRGVPVRRPDRRRDLSPHALRVAVGDGRSAHAVGRLSRGHARVTHFEGRRALPGIRDQASRRAQRDRCPGLISLAAGYPAPDVFPWDDLAVDHRADPRAPRRQHPAVRRDARLSAAHRASAARTRSAPAASARASRT